MTIEFSDERHIADMDAIFARVRDGLTEDHDAKFLAELVSAVNDEKERAYAQAGRVRKEADNPLTPPAAARSKIAMADLLEVDARRLHAAQEELSQRRAAKQTAEREAERKARYTQVKADTDTLAERIAKEYPKHARAIVDLLDKMKENEIAVRGVNEDLNGDPWLPNAERIARNAGLVGVRMDFSISEVVRLPAIGAQEPLLWPRR